MEKKKISEEEYLAIEQEAEFKSEFYNGEMFALAGAGFNHNTAGLNLATLLNIKLTDRNCYVFNNDMRLNVKDFNLYIYPDVMVVFDDKLFLNNRKDTITNPLLICEVLSKSTESYDRGKKFEFYRSIPSLKEYVLISSDRPLIEVFTKDDSGGWVLRDENDINKSVNLSSVNCTIPLSEVYHKIEFEN